jgi:hypothetical protein
MSVSRKTKRFKPAFRKPTPSIPTPVNPSPGGTVLPSKPAGGGATSVDLRTGRPPGGAAIPTPVNPSPGGTLLPAKPGGVGTTGFKSGSGGFASSLFGHGAPAGGGATSVNTGMGPAPGRASFGMKKGGKVKAKMAVGGMPKKAPAKKPMPAKKPVAKKPAPKKK